MNQVEQWFSILQRKRLKIANFKDKQALAERLQAFIDEWNAHAHPFNWTTQPVPKIMAKCDPKPTHAKAAWIPYPFCGDVYLDTTAMPGIPIKKTQL